MLIFNCLAALALAPAPVDAHDLARIDRVIAKEPAYQTKSPGYFLLVFGPEAKTRVWLVLDGNVLYVDRNGNGNLTEEGERLVSKPESPGIFVVGEIMDRDGQPIYSKLVLHVPQRGRLEGFICSISGKYRQLGTGGSFADRPQDAPIIHFNGPLTMGLHVKPELVPGKEVKVTAWIGTPSLGKDMRASWVDFTRYEKENVPGVPEGIHPLATIELANKDPNGQPIRLPVRLTWRH